MRKTFIIGLAILIGASVAPVRAKMSEYKVSAGGEPVFKKIMNYKPSVSYTHLTLPTN